MATARLAPLQLPTGTAATPTLNFGTSNTGLYAANSTTTAISSNGGPGITISSTGTPVNYMDLKSGPTGNFPQIQALGTDTNIGITYATKGNQSHSFVTYVGSTAYQAFVFGFDSAPTGPTNYPQFVAAGSGSYPYLQAAGGDASIGMDFYTKGGAPIRVQGPLRSVGLLTAAASVDTPSILFPAQTNDIATPAAGYVGLFGKEIAGLGVVRYVNAQGLDHTIQRSMAVNSFESAMGGLAAPAVTGGIVSMTVTNASATAAMASTNLATSLMHTIFSSTTTAGGLGTMVSTPLRFWRGNAAGLGGFTYTIRFSLSALQSGMRVFVGLADNATALTNVDYTTATTPGKIGLAINANSGNWNLINNVSGTAPTVLALSANFAVNTTDVIELILACAPNTGSIGYRVRNLSTGNISTGSLTTNIPGTTTFLVPSLAITNNATAAAATLRFYKWTKEADN